MTSRIEKYMSKGRQLIGYITAGDGGIDQTIEVVKRMNQYGIDLIELGIPFTDPIADGPTIYSSHQRALKHISSVNEYLELVSIIKKEVNCAIIAFTYYNPLLQYGNQFYEKFKHVGGDGLICVDYPIDQAPEIVKHCEDKQIDIIPLVTCKSSDERKCTLSRYATSMVYYVNHLGITGIRKENNNLELPSAQQMKQSIKKFVACGFGVHTKDHIDQIHKVADAAVIGSYLVEGAFESLHELEKRLEMIT